MNPGRIGGADIQEESGLHSGFLRIWYIMSCAWFHLGTIIACFSKIKKRVLSLFSNKSAGAFCAGRKILGTV